MVALPIVKVVLVLYTMFPVSAPSLDSVLLATLHQTIGPHQFVFQLVEIEHWVCFYSVCFVPTLLVMSHPVNICAEDPHTAQETNAKVRAE